MTALLSWQRPYRVLRFCYPANQATFISGAIVTGSVRFSGVGTNYISRLFSISFGVRVVGYRVGRCAALGVRVKQFAQEKSQRR